MKYRYKPRPQKYKGRIYRSGLEAKYARLFDAIGFSHVYEPDTELDGWLPDFMVIDGLEQIWFVEIKPLSMVDDELKIKIMKAVNNSTDALILSEKPNLQFKNSFGESPMHGNEFSFEYDGMFYREFGHSGIFREKETGKVFIASCSSADLYKDGKLHEEIQNVSLEVADYWNTIQNKTMYLRPLKFRDDEKRA